MICEGCRSGADGQMAHHCEGERRCPCQHLPFIGASRESRTKVSSDTEGGYEVWVPRRTPDVADIVVGTPGQAS